VAGNFRAGFTLDRFMPFTIATWNINSIRLRMPLVEQFLRRFEPDVLCLQEIKCPEELFPYSAFRDLGYEHIAVSGQKGYHGVATVARRPIDLLDKRKFCGIEDCRHVSVRVKAGGRTLVLDNFYVPAGGDEPDPDVNPKFRHKLDFIEEMRGTKGAFDGETASVLVGDLNIAPLEADVWSHKQLLKVVSHTPVETQGLESMRTGGGWADLMRQHRPSPEKLYTWWSYRAQDWSASDRGRRLDHVWSSKNLADSLVDIDVLRDARGWERPSDHVPVLARFSLD
jgi:exodeoxyribonuclease III